MDKEERDKKLRVFILNCGHKYFDLPRPLVRCCPKRTIDKAIILHTIKKYTGTYNKAKFETTYSKPVIDKYCGIVGRAIQQRKGWVYDKYILFERHVAEELKKEHAKIK